jgi:uncharacterized RDD family membrane protein YckC
MNYAGFWKRFAALLIDGIIIWLLSMVLIIPFYIPALGIIIAGFYHVIFETSPLRATPGKSLMKIAVVKSNGSLMTIKDSIIRFAVSLISSFILCIGYLMAIFTEKKQTLHDIVADTIVINEVFAEQNFWDIFVNQCKIIFVNNHRPTSTFSDGRAVSSQSLEELYNLHQKGILTDEEYRIKKEEYLKRL